MYSNTKEQNYLDSDEQYEGDFPEYFLNSPVSAQSPTDSLDFENNSLSPDLEGFSEFEFQGDDDLYLKSNAPNYVIPSPLLIEPEELEEDIFETPPIKPTEPTKFFTSNQSKSSKKSPEKVFLSRRMKSRPTPYYPPPKINKSRPSMNSFSSRKHVEYSPNSKSKALSNGFSKASIPSGKSTSYFVNMPRSSKDDRMMCDEENDDDLNLGGIDGIDGTDSTSIDKYIPWEDINCFVEKNIHGLKSLRDMLLTSGGQFNPFTKSLIQKMKTELEEISKILVQKENSKFFEFDLRHLKKKKRVKHSSCFFDPDEKNYIVTYGKKVRFVAFLNEWIWFQISQLCRTGSLNSAVKFSVLWSNGREEPLTYELKRESKLGSDGEMEEEMFLEAECCFRKPATFSLKIVMPKGQDNTEEITCVSEEMRISGFCDAQYRKKITDFKKRGFIQKCNDDDLM